MSKINSFLLAFLIIPFFGNSQFVENKGQVLDINENFHPEVKYYHSNSNAGVYFQEDRVVYNLVKVDEVNEDLYSSDKEGLREAKKKREATYFRMDLVFKEANQNIDITPGDKLPGVNHFYLNKRNGIRDVKSYESIKYNNVYPNVDVIFHTSQKGMKYDIVLNEGARIEDVKLSFEGTDVSLIDGKLIMPTKFGDITEEIPLSFIDGDKEQRVNVEYVMNEDGTVGFSLKGNIQYSKLTIDPILEWATYFNQTIDPTGFSNTLDYVSTHLDDDGNYFVYGEGFSGISNYPVVNPGGAYTDVYDNSADLYIVKFDQDRQLVWGTFLGGSGSDGTSWGHPMTTDGNTLHIVGEDITTGAPFTNGGGFFENVGNRNFWARFNKNTGALNHLTSLSNGDHPSIAISDAGTVAIVSDNRGGSTTWYLPILNRGGAFNQATNGGSTDMGLLMFNAAYNQIWGTFLGGPGSQEYFTCDFDSNENLYFAGGTSWFTASNATNERLVTLGGAYNQNVQAGGVDVMLGKFNPSGQLIWHTLYGGNTDEARAAQQGEPARVIVHPTTNELILATNTTSDDLPIQNLPGAYNKGLPTDPDFGPGGFGGFVNYAGYIAKFSPSGVRNWATYFYSNSNDSGTNLQDFGFGACNKFYVGAAGSQGTLTGASTGYNLLTNSSPSRTGYITMLNSTSFGFEWDSYLNSNNALDCHVAANVNQAKYFAVSQTRNNNIPVVDPGNGAYFEANNWGPTESTLGIYQFHPSFPPDVSNETTCSGVGVTLTVSGGMGAPYNWYSSSTSTTIINTGTTYTVAPTTTTTYYVSSGTGICGSPRVPVTVTVSPAPAAPIISSNSPLCIGDALNLTSNTISGATYNWTGPNSFSSSLEDPSIGSVTSAMAGTYDLFVTVAGCPSATASTTVNINTNSTAPTGITGTAAICSGSSTTLTLSGGSAGTGATAQWYSGSCGGTPAGSGNSIIVSPTANTTYFVRYEGTCNTTGCASQTVTVTAPPSAGILSGTQNICVGSTTTFSSTQGGGSWSTSNGAIATVNTSGVVTGQSAGTATITYTVTGTGGCPNATATRTVTVAAPPNAGTLSGNQNICEGSTTTFSSTQGGGSWSTSNGAIATVNGSGVVTGQSAGTATITYTVSGTGGCPNATATRTVTVTAPPSAGTLSGTQIICEGLTTTFSSTQGGGSWSTSNGAVATVNGSGVITGQSDGTATITYTVIGSGGCPNATAIRTVTVNPTPTVTVPSGGNVCVGQTLSLSPSTGGTWSSSDASVATITNGGVVTGIASGTAEMTFTNTTTGCSSTASAGSITVIPLPTFSVSTSNPTACGASDGTITISGLNASTTYQVSLASGAFTTETSDGSGVITLTGLTAGSYSPIEVSLNGCSTIDNATFDLNDPSSPTINVPNGGVLCEGDVLNVTPSTGGTWSSNNLGVATITNGGLVTGVAGGTATITYTETATGCSSLASAGSITVNAAPTVTVPNGGDVCEGETLNLSPSTGGTWSSSDPSVATVTNSGVVTGVSPGTAEMTFTNTTTGCSSLASTGTINVNPLPTFSVSLTDPSSCGASDGTITISGLNASTTYQVSLASGGFAAETSDGSGVITLTGLTAGSYSPIEVSLNGCSTIDNATFDLNDPSSPTINVPNGGVLCEGDVLNVTPSTGGTWSSNNLGVATITNGGLVTGVSGGTATITYTETATGCSSLASAGSITVNAAPTVTVPNGGDVCEGETLNLSPSTGGTWSSSDPSVATVTNSGVVTGVSSGTAEMTFTNTTTGCSSLASSGTINVNPLPTFTISLTNPSSCGASDGTITISGLNASTSYDVSIASGAFSTETSDASGVIILTGLGTGSYAPIEVSLNSCSTIDNGTYDLNDPSSPTINVPNGGELCEGEVLNVTPNSGGTWSSSDPGIATIDNGGVLTGISAGTATVTYTETATGCSSLASAGNITVNPIPTVTVPNSGNVCEGATLSLTPSTGGTWSSSDPSVASVTNDGVVTGVSAGTAEMTFTNTATGCSSVASSGTITVNAAPTITVPTSNEICEGSTLNLEPTTGGTWTSSDAGVATITNGGVVTGVSGGTADMVFTNTTTGCSSIASNGTVIVNTSPTLTLGVIDCDKPTSSFSVEYTASVGASVTSSIGTVTSTAVTNIPNDQSVTITASAEGCPSVEETVSTDECDDVIVEISNGVSPNSDGLNDFLEITNLEAYPDHNLSIYNRWGDIVFQSSPYENDWNGQNNVGGIGGEELPAGTYFYILELGEDDEPIKGYIELKR